MCRLRLWAFQNVLCAALFDDAPGLQEDQPVHAPRRQPKVVGYQKHCGEFARQKVPKQLHRRRCHKRIERRGRFIQNDQIGRADQGHGDNKALLHAAAPAPWAFAQIAPFDPERAKQSGAVRTARGQTQGQFGLAPVKRHRPQRVERLIGALRHMGHAVALRAQIVNQRMPQRGFPRARRTHEADTAPWFNLQRCGMQDRPARANCAQANCFQGHSVSLVS